MDFESDWSWLHDHDRKKTLSEKAQENVATEAMLGSGKRKGRKKECKDVNSKKEATLQEELPDICSTNTSSSTSTNDAAGNSSKLDNNLWKILSTPLHELVSTTHNSSDSSHLYTRLDD